MQKKIHIGTSGWSYKHWRGTFYPQEIKIKDHFNYYTRRFNTVEINNTFYGLPSAETFLKWNNAVNDDFLFIIKANRYITHIKKLSNASESMTLFMERIKLLGKKLGPVLFQLPPTLKPNLEILEIFLKELPENHRYVFEFRNKDWHTEELYSLLKKYNCALCIYELAGYMSPVKITANFVYLRLHGPDDKYQGNYSDEILKEWAAQCIKWSETKEVFVYFDNDEKGYAAFNALKLKGLINF